MQTNLLGRSAAVGFLVVALLGVLPGSVIASPHEYRPPPPRSLHSVVYDMARDRLVVFGGCAAELSNEVWTFDLASSFWSQIETTGPEPTPRRDQAMVYDDRRDAVVLFGGWDGRSFLNDAWRLDLSGTPRWGSSTTLVRSSSPDGGRRTGTRARDATCRCASAWTRSGSSRRQRPCTSTIFR